MSQRSVNVLLTSVGRRVELVNAFKHAYRELQLDGKIVGTDINPLAPGLHVVDRPYIVPRIGSETYIETLTAICRQEQIHLVFPLVDPDIPRLSSARAEFEASGARLAVIPPHAAEIANDKWLTYQFFERIGIPTPRSWLPGEVPADIPFPLFLKPRFGSASQGTYRLENARQLEFFSEYVPQPIIQEYLPGAEITNDVLCNLDGQILAIVSRKRLEVRGGEVVKGVTIYDEAIMQFCMTIANHLPAVGPITIQCIARDDTFCFTEINARFGGGLPLGIAAGVDSPKILLALAAGLDIERPRLGQYTTGLYVSRFDSAFFIDESSRDAVAKHCL